jgi:uncharacterized hydrophobic protein (TIGR00271 family)
MPYHASMLGAAEAGIVHLRLVVPADSTDRVLQELRASAAVVNIALVTGSSIKPKGDLLLCDVAREEASVIVRDLRRLGLDKRGSISLEDVDSTISTGASRAVRAAAGSPSNAVVWEEVEARTSESAELSFNFVAFMVLAMLIAAIGILTDSQILIIGAMVVGPEFGALAGLCVALVERRLDLAARSALALVVGFPIAILVTLLTVFVLRETGTAPEALVAQERPDTFFIAHPNTFSVLVALIAGAAGLLSLATAKSGALMGVLISVTTIPAAANVGVAAAYGDAVQLRGAGGQLGLNLACIVLGGVLTLATQRIVFMRRLRRAVDT